MPEQKRRPARYLSTPMIKGELQTLLTELVPGKSWPKRTRLRDLVEFALERFPDDTADSREQRALELAHVIHDQERR